MVAQFALSELKKVKAFCENLTSSPDWKEVIRNIENNEYDFTVDRVRFIKDSEILDVLASELKSDEYLLGSFASWLISDATGWPICLIDALQKAEGHEELGKAIADTEDDSVRKIAEGYSSSDGFGHHFNSYDGSEEEIKINNEWFHVFDCR